MLAQKAMKRNYQELGQFELTQPCMRVTDPCYGKDTWCCGVIPNCCTGTWTAAITIDDDDGRAKLLAAMSKDAGFDFSKFDEVWTDDRHIHYMADWLVCDFEVGVDSGQAGFFDDAYYQDDHVFDGTDAPARDFGSTWYSKCCELTLSGEAGIIPYGAVSCSGYGDGCYTAIIHKNQQGLVDCVLVSFIADEEEE